MGRVRMAAVVAGFAIALLSCVGALAVAPDARNEPSEQDFLTRINGARSSAGVPSVQMTADLVDVARRHSQEMATRHRLAHNGNLGNEVSGWTALGENVGSGPSVAVVHDAFMSSEIHRSDILDRRFSQVGVGVVWDGDTLWVTEVFRQPSTSSAGSPPPPAPAPPPPPPAPAPRPAPAPAATPAPTVAAAPVAAPPPPTAAPAPTTPVDASATSTTAPPVTAEVKGASLTSRSRPAARAAASGEHAAPALATSVPRIPPAVGVAAGLLALVVAAQGAAVRHLRLA